MYNNKQLSYDIQLRDELNGMAVAALHPIHTHHYTPDGPVKSLLKSMRVLNRRANARAA